MLILNYTPHTINVYDAEGREVIRSYPPSGEVARVNVTAKEVGTANGVPVVHNTFGAVEGLPEPLVETRILVSLMVLQAANRHDLLAPDTGPASVVRDDAGNIVGVRRFVVQP